MNAAQRIAANEKRIAEIEAELASPWATRPGSIDVSEVRAAAGFVRMLHYNCVSNGGTDFCQGSAAYPMMMLATAALGAAEEPGSTAHYAATVWRQRALDLLCAP